MAKTYEFHDFMHYPNVAFKLAAISPFNWSGSSQQQQQEHQQHFLYAPWQTLKWLVTKVWFTIGAASLIYQPLGMLIYMLAPQSANLYTAANMEPENQISLIALISETGGILGLAMVCTCKMFIIFWHGKRISKLLKELREMFPCARVQHDPNQLYRAHYFATNSAILMKATTIFFIFAVCVYNLLPFLEMFHQYYFTDMPITYGYQSNTWYPWQTKDNSRTWWGFLINYWCQMQASRTGASFMMAGQFMFCFFITQLQMHFDYLCNALMCLDAASSKANDDLKYLIAYHIKLLRIFKEINFIFNISFLVYFITSSVAICLMAISMVMVTSSNNLKYSVGLLVFLVFNFFICFNGSEFTATSDKLVSAAFYNNWFDGDIYYRRMIFFLMMRSGESNVLRAYKFATVSMPTYMAILKLSYNLFTFMRTMS